MRPSGRRRRAPAACARPSRVLRAGLAPADLVERAPQQRELGDVLGPAGSLLRTDHVEERGNENREAGAELEARRVTPQVLVTASARRGEDDVEVSGLRRERPDVGA